MQRDDLIYDFMQARTDIVQWKTHILRSVNQEAAKQDQLGMITYNATYALIVMDWAMELLQLKYRKKQSDWYGKKGLSWHISTVISSVPDKAGTLELQSFAHLFDTCRQDWFAVSSIIENTLEIIKTQKPHTTHVYLRSDEAGCYHNNSLIAAAKDIGQRVGITVCRYDYTEPRCVRSNLMLDGNMFGRVCRLPCNKGYELRGSIARTCDKISGTDHLHWTGNATYCEGEE